MLVTSIAGGVHKMINQLQQGNRSLKTASPPHIGDVRSDKKLKNQVALHVIDAERINAEYNKQGIGYLTILWAVSLLAMLKNGLIALALKVTTQRQTPWTVILWGIGRSTTHYSSLWVDGLSRFNHQAKCGAASWKALDLFYNYYETVEPKLANDTEGGLTRFWIERMHNRQAVAIRLKMASLLIAEAILQYQHEPVVRIVSIASGSAQAVIQGILMAGCRNVEVILIDNDQAALDTVAAMAEMVGLKETFSFVHDTSRKLEAICSKHPPQIIEMMGFLDYRPDHKACQLIQRIYGLLAGNGTFFTCNIHPNPEKIFLNWVLLWPMVYRSKEAFSNLLIEGKFKPDKIQLYYDPFHIHGIAVCQKR